MKRISPIIICILFFASCKKTKLEGDLSFFVGTWEWKYTVQTVDVCEFFPYDSLITNSPSLAGYTYSLTFEKKGKLIVKKNGKQVDNYRLVLYDRLDKTDNIIFLFKLNNKKKKKVRFSRYYNRPLCIETTNFPEGTLEGKVDGCEDTHNVFEKAN